MVNRFDAVARFQGFAVVILAFGDEIIVRACGVKGKEILGELPFWVEQSELKPF